MKTNAIGWPTHLLLFLSYGQWPPLSLPQLAREKLSFCCLALIHKLTSEHNSLCSAPISFLSQCNSFSSTADFSPQPSPGLIYSTLTIPHLPGTPIDMPMISCYPLQVGLSVTSQLFSVRVFVVSFSIHWFSLSFSLKDTNSEFTVKSNWSERSACNQRSN